jgi:hypothetical protein
VLQVGGRGGHCLERTRCRKNQGRT